MNNGQFDEMQTQTRNQIGNQTFIMLSLLLLVYTMLYSMGFHWMKYPLDIQMIVYLCAAYYGIRLALNNALIPQKQIAKKPIAAFLSVYIIALIFVAVLPLFVKPSVGSSSQSGIGTVLLQVISWGVVVVIAIILYVNRHREDKH